MEDPPLEAGASELTEPENIRGRVLGGFAWSMGSSVISQGSRLISAVFLARLLTPSDYGLAGMALAFSSLVLSVSDLSMGAGLVQRRRITEADRSTVFWTSAGIGLLLTLGGIAAAGPLASFYGEPRVRPLFMVVSISFLLVALQTTQASIMQREMQFRSMSLRVTAGVVAGGAAGIVAAALGAGAWALIVQQLTISSTSVLLLWTISTWRPKFMFSRASLRNLGGFGLNLFGARLLDYLNRNTDNILVGRYLGSASLGAYSIAYNLMFLPLDRLIIPIQDTLFPAFSRWQDDRERLAAVWLRVFRVIAVIVVPAMVGLAIVAPDFVHVILGEKWHTAVPVLQILCAVAAVQSLGTLGQRVLTAIDRTKTILAFTIVETAATIPAFAIGLHWGIVGVATCYSLVTIPLYLGFLTLTIRALGVSVLRIFRSIGGVLLATALMAAACLPARLLLVHAGQAPWLRLAVVVLLGSAVFSGVTLLAQPEVARELRSLRGRRS